jgi:hypothetical protein
MNGKKKMILIDEKGVVLARRGRACVSLHRRSPFPPRTSSSVRGFCCCSGMVGVMARACVMARDPARVACGALWACARPRERKSGGGQPAKVNAVSFRLFPFFFFSFFPLHPLRAHPSAAARATATTMPASQVATQTPVAMSGVAMSGATPGEASEGQVRESANAAKRDGALFPSRARAGGPPARCLTPWLARD